MNKLRILESPIQLAVCLILLTVPQLSWAQQQRYNEIENPAGLERFYQALNEIRTGKRTRPVLIIQYGDSHTAADFLTGSIRSRFQKDFGDGANDAGGVNLYILGVNGMRAVQLTGWSKELFKANVSDYSPDLIILAYGTNEVVDLDWTLDSYGNLFATIIRRFRQAAPAASILVLGPPDRLVIDENRWISAPRLPTLTKAQRLAARQEGAAFWSAGAAMGGAGSMGRWVSEGLGQGDRVHLTVSGYGLLGGLFYADLVHSYNLFLTRQTKPRPQPDSTPGRIVGRIRFHKKKSNRAKQCGDVVTNFCRSPQRF